MTPLFPNLIEGQSTTSITTPDGDVLVLLDSQDGLPPGALVNEIESDVSKITINIHKAISRSQPGDELFGLRRCTAYVLAREFAMSIAIPGGPAANSTVCTHPVLGKYFEAGALDGALNGAERVAISIAPRNDNDQKIALELKINFHKKGRITRPFPVLEVVFERDGTVRHHSLSTENSSTDEQSFDTALPTPAPELAQMSAA